MHLSPPSRSLLEVLITVPQAGKPIEVSKDDPQASQGALANPLGHKFTLTKG